MGLGGARTAAQVAKSVAKCGEAGLSPPPRPRPAPALYVRAPLPSLSPGRSFRPCVNPTKP